MMLGNEAWVILTFKISAQQRLTLKLISASSERNLSLIGINLKQISLF